MRRREFVNGTAAAFLGSMFTQDAGAEESAATVRRAIENAYDARYRRRDKTSYRRLLADDCLFVGDGKVTDVNTSVETMPPADGTYGRTDHFDFHSITVRDDVAYAVYNVWSDIIDGKQSHHWRCVESTILRRSDDTWHLALVHSTRLEPLQLRPGDLDFLNGAWAGTLEYLDYTDGRTTYTIKAALHCKKLGNALEYKFSYVEPDGTRKFGDGTILTLLEDGSLVQLNDEFWRVTGRTIEPRNNSYEVILMRSGSDNEQPAELRRILAFAESTLTIRTVVKTGRDGTPFTRNKYILHRE